jgi:formylglycine-generating enzyme required for sulfatase activity
MSACPVSEQLRDYVVGRLGPVDHLAIDTHVDHCPACWQAVVKLDNQSSTPLPRAGKGPEHAFDDPVLKHLLSRVKEMGHRSGPDEVPGDAGEQVLDDYVLLERLGAGGMGQVFKAEHRRLKRIVALKLLSPELLPSPAARARFAREVKALARLASPHIVAVHDAGEARGKDFLVMEYIDGVNLSDLIKDKGPLSIPLALNYLIQAARGIEQAHSAGIVHRDIKPANLLVDTRGLVKVLDLGLARLPADQQTESELTSHGVVMGTAGFMAPEQAADVRRADHRADIYSLGCTLFYLLTGRAPYEGATPLDILFAHREQPIPSLRSARPDCPPALDNLFRTLVAKRPEDRPATMSAVITSLESVLTKGGKARPSPRRRKPWLVAAGILLALGGVLAWSALPPAGTPAGASADKAGPAPRAIRPGAAAPVPRAPVVEMVLLRPGEFWRGSPDEEKGAGTAEKPRRKIKISQPFFLGKHKITQQQFEEVMKRNPSAFSAKGGSRDKVSGLDTRQHPVESLSWLEAVQFCNRLSARHGLPAYYDIDGTTVTVHGGTGYRLPTEAEWEYACRAGTTTRWSFGDDEKKLPDHAWFADNAGGRTHPVGKKKPNPWGLFDMHGNVPEWCWDRYDRGYYRSSPVIDPAGSGRGETRVFRGGGFNVSANETRSAARDSLGASYRVLTLVGLRVARNVEP